MDGGIQHASVREQKLESRYKRFRLRYRRTRRLHGPVSEEPQAKLTAIYLELLSPTPPVALCRAVLDLRSLTVEKTHDITVHLEDEAGSLRLLVTVTGSVSSTDQEVSSMKRNEIVKRYVSAVWSLAVWSLAA